MYQIYKKLGFEAKNDRKQEKTGFCLKKILKPAVLVLKPLNWAQIVPWKKVGLECNNDIALSYIKITKK